MDGLNLQKLISIRDVLQKETKPMKCVVEKESGAVVHVGNEETCNEWLVRRGYSIEDCEI